MLDRSRRVAFVIVLSLALLGAAAPEPGMGGSGGAADWTPFHSSEGRFRVLLPEPPRLRSTRQETFIGPIHQARHTLEIGDLQVVVEHHDIPRLATLIMPASLILDRARDSLIQDVAGRERAARSLTWQGYPAREVTYEIPGDPSTLERALLILVESRLYLVIATWPQQMDPDPQISRFFLSFEVLRP